MNLKKIVLPVLIMFGIGAFMPVSASDIPKYNPGKSIKQGFYKLENTENMHEVFEAIRLNDSKVLIIGGGDQNDIDENTDILDLNTLKFSKTSSPVYIHYWSEGIARLGNGNLLLRHEDENGGKYVSSFEIYNPETNKFTDTGLKLHENCFGEIYSTKDGNAVVYSRAYYRNKKDEFNRPLMYEIMNIYDYKTNKFLKPIRPWEKGYITEEKMTSMRDKNVYVGVQGSSVINIPDKKMLFVINTRIPKHLKSAKSAEEILNAADFILSEDNKRSKRAYVYFYGGK